MYRHIVLFRVHDDVSDGRATAAVRRLRSLAVLPGVLSWRIEQSLDTRKGRLIVEDASFADREAFESFRADTRHAVVAAMMSEISDWWIGDYIV